MLEPWGFVSSASVSSRSIDGQSPSRKWWLGGTETYWGRRRDQRATASADLRLNTSQYYPERTKVRGSLWEKQADSNGGQALAKEGLGSVLRMQTRKLRKEPTYKV